MSQNSESNVATAELESTTHRLLFAVDAVSLMQEQAQSQQLQLCNVEAVGVAAETVQTAAESSK